MDNVLSVVMPAYNASKYIAEAIASVQAQTYGNWELIIADDCSTDSTPDIVTEATLADPRIRLIRLAENSGAAFVPRTEAVATANGEYIVELDADDYLAPDYLERIAKRLDETGADAVFGAMTFVNPDGSEEPLPTPLAIGEVVEGRSLVALTLDGWRNGCKGAIRRSLYLEAAKHHDVAEATISADELLTRIILLKAGHVAFVASTYFYRIHPQSVTRRADAKIFDILDTDIRLHRLVDSHFPEQSTERHLINNQSLANLWSSLRTFATFEFATVADRDHALSLLRNAYRHARVFKGLRRMGLKRTLALAAGVDAVIAMHKIVHRLGKRE